MNWEKLLFATLLTWRITHFWVRETGPFNVGNRARRAIGLYYDEYSECQGKNEIAKALCCFHCSSVWIAGAVVWWQWGIVDIARTLVVSAAAIVLDEWRRA